ncbi:Na+/H+ antiporter subunit E [Corallococcus macrosporus]|uniref:Sodium:proton antiporter n=2 Tax=Myxococcaceae TaxID=31 RepID=A0A250JXI3_9BACT|nr:Na+/H+ antiporter subunit E [Corallococcus macrosporus]AEI67391.1 Na+/H+ ion antiporter [Corallococcus macrosporus]ATB48182.1 sodium:proton antiporter [Corallococcus macrosporus DSM 14697]
MTALLWNLMLALLWAAMLGSVTPANLLTGFVIGFILLAFIDTPHLPSRYATQTWNVARLVARVAWDVLVANARVAYEIATPRLISRPAIYRYDMEARTDAEITLLTLIVTFAPGTVGLEISEDRKALYVHVMFASTREAFCRDLRERVEIPLLRALR